MKVAMVAVTEKGYEAGRKVKRSIAKCALYIPEKLGKKRGAILFGGKLLDLAGELFAEFDGIIFCMALGIVSRVIAPHLKDKHTDPAVIAVDTGGHFAISVLSGHEGGANGLAVRVGNILGAEPVVTTASESKRNVVVGVGCRRGIKKEEVLRAIGYALAQVQCPINKVRCVTTIDLKRNEQGLRDACLELGIPLRIISSELIENFNGAYQRSPFVKEKIGVEGVSEPCALLAARNPKLVLPKKKVGKVTVAVAREGST